MKDFHKDMAPVSGDIEKIFKDLTSPDWAIPFLGRKLSSACRNKFKDADTKGFKIELPWEGQVKYESHNAYDDSTYVHELVVTMYSDGPAVGRIKSVHAHHWEHWHTSSNWQDHSERCTYDKREPNADEIAQYKELLEGLTEGGSSELVLTLSEALASVVQNKKGAVRVTFDGPRGRRNSFYKEISISFSSEDARGPVSIVVNLDHLMEALDYSRIYIEAVNSKENRRKLGICKDESWTLQYCLNFFNLFRAEELYPNIELSLKAWLYKLYSSCAEYRNFMDIPAGVWWRDAWWRLQEVVEGKLRTVENRKLLVDNCRDRFYNGRIGNVEDPFSKIIGTLSRPYKSPISPYSVDMAPELCDYVKGEQAFRKFRSVIANGIKWSICNRTSDELAIDLGASQEVEEIEDGVVIIPYQIDGCVVTEIHTLSEGNCKNWRKVIFSAPGDEGQNKGGADSSSLQLEEDDGACTVDDDDSDYVTPKYESPLRIHKGAFRGWQSLEEVYFQRRHNELDSYAFAECKKLRKVDSGGNYCRVWERSFYSCSDLEEIGTLYDSVGAEAFKDCTKLKAVSITYRHDFRMGESTFAGCIALESVHIEDLDSDAEDKRIYSLSRKAFSGCTSLKHIHLPKNIRILKEYCLENCSAECLLQYEGDEFWFLGENALPEIRIIYWGRTVRYENEDIELSALLDKLGIKRERYVVARLKYHGSGYTIQTIIERILGITPRRRYRAYDEYSDYGVDDCSPNTFEDAYEIYGSRLWDA